MTRSRTPPPIYQKSKGEKKTMANKEKKQEQEINLDTSATKLGAVGVLSKIEQDTELQTTRYTRVFDLGVGADGRHILKTVSAVGDTAKMLDMLDVSAQADELVSLMKCVALNYLSDMTAKIGVKSFDELCTLYHISTASGKLYRRVAETFLEYDITNGNLKYKLTAMRGASMSNMLQMLTLSSGLKPEDEKTSAELFEDIKKYIKEEKLHPLGTTSNIKQEIHDIKNDEGRLKASNRKGKGAKQEQEQEQDEAKATAQAITTLSSIIGAISDEDENKVALVEAIATIENYFTK